MILAVDPGINACGCALFTAPSHGAALSRAWLARTGSGAFSDPSTVARCAAMALAVYRGLTVFEWRGLTVFVAEWPQIYPPRRGGKRVDPNVALVPLAGVQAAIAAHLSPTITTVQYYPRDWKGTLDGDAFVRVIQRALNPDEERRIAPTPESLKHNVYDAIGLGLKHLGRLERRRVISRGTPRSNNP